MKIIPIIILGLVAITVITYGLACYKTYMETKHDYKVFDLINGGLGLSLITGPICWLIWDFSAAIKAAIITMAIGVLLECYQIYEKTGKPLLAITHAGIIAVLAITVTLTLAIQAVLYLIFLIVFFLAGGKMVLPIRR